jgi:D-alanyl-lipoteichoic acid acyltransferase DltB (MBOAT superfamily)
LYIPLGGSIGGNWTRIRNTFIIFVVSGFWHGANWTFIAWGALNALFIMPSIILKTNRNHLETVAQGRILPSAKEFLQVAITFSMTVFAWIFFRSENISQAIGYVSGIFSKSIFTIPTIRPSNLILLIILFMIVEWFGREEQYAIAKLGLKWKRPFRYGIYYLIVFVIIMFSKKDQPFIYFQF